MAHDAWLESGLDGLSDSPGRRVFRAFLLAVAATGLFALYAWSQFRGLKDPAAMEHAQLARHMAEGRGMLTRCVRPLDLWCLDSRAEPPRNAWPDLRHGPAYPFVLGAGFRLLSPSFAPNPGGAVFEPEKKVIIPLGILFSIATGLILLALGNRLLPPPAGTLAAVLFLVSDRVLAASLSGTPLPMMMFLACASVYMAVRAGDAKSDGRSCLIWFPALLASAACCGAAVLTDYAMLALIPPLAVWCWSSFDDRRWPAVLALLLTVTLIVAPWLMRNQTVSGHWFGLAPFAALHNTAVAPGDSIERTVSPVLHNVRIAIALKAAAKDGIVQIARGEIGFGAYGLMGAFFLASLLHRFDRPAAMRLQWCTALGLAATALCALVFGREGSWRFCGLLPLVILFGAGFSLYLAQQLATFDAGWQAVASWVLVLVTAIPAAATVTGSRAGPPYPPYFAPLTAYVASLFGPEEVLCTDIPWATAWYGNRTSVLLPQSLDEFAGMRKERLSVAGLYLTTETSDRPYARELVAGAYRSWFPLLNRMIPEGFPFSQGINLPPGTVDQVLLTDRVRWGNHDVARPSPSR